MLLSQWLKQELESRNLNSLRKAGEEIGVAHTTIQRILNGNSVDIATIELLSNWSGVDKVTLTNAVGIHMDVDTSNTLTWEMILGRYPELAEALRLLIDRYRNGDLQPHTIASIVQYIRFAMSEADV
jgi:transcriptional regulator with XRE-family HTH domain